MTENEEQQQQFEYELQCEIDNATYFLMRNGYLVIPACDIAKYIGNFDIVPRKEVDIHPDEIPF